MECKEKLNGFIFFVNCWLHCFGLSFAYVQRWASTLARRSNARHWSKTRPSIERSERSYNWQKRIFLHTIQYYSLVFFFLHALFLNGLSHEMVSGKWCMVGCGKLSLWFPRCKLYWRKKQKASWVECLTCMSEPVFVNVFGAQESTVLTKKHKGSWDKCLTCMPEPLFVNVLVQESIPPSWESISGILIRFTNPGSGTWFPNGPIRQKKYLERFLLHKFICS